MPEKTNKENELTILDWTIIDEIRYHNFSFLTSIQDYIGLGVLVLTSINHKNANHTISLSEAMIFIPTKSGDVKKGWLFEPFNFSKISSNEEFEFVAYKEINKGCLVRHFNCIKNKNHTFSISESLSYIPNLTIKNIPFSLLDLESAIEDEKNKTK